VAKDFERTVQTSETLIERAATRLALRCRAPFSPSLAVALPG
jgi:hypothetical protein